MMLWLMILMALLFPRMSFGQNLSGNVTCQDLIDFAEGKMSRSNDGGRTYVPINVPQPRDAFEQALLAHDTYLCRRLARNEISIVEFDALHAEKVYQLRSERHKVLVERKNLKNQERALRNQQAEIQNQREAVRVQRQTTAIQALQAEAARRQQAAQHQELMEQQRFHQEVQQQQAAQHQELMEQQRFHQEVQQQQLEEIRQEQSRLRQERARPRSFSCFGGGNYIHCN